jgi:hypothetical protein
MLADLTLIDFADFIPILHILHKSCTFNFAFIIRYKSHNLVTLSTPNYANLLQILHLINCADLICCICYKTHLLHLLQSLHSPICAELICCICCKAYTHQFGQSSSAVFVAKMTLTNLCRAHLLHLLQSLHSPISAELICCICYKAYTHQLVQSSSAAFVAKLTQPN